MHVTLYCCDCPIIFLYNINKVVKRGLTLLEWLWVRCTHTHIETETRRKTKWEGEREPNSYENAIQAKVAYSMNASIPGVEMNSQVVKTEKINHRKKAEFTTAHKFVASEIISCFFFNIVLQSFVAKVYC